MNTQPGSFSNIYTDCILHIFVNVTWSDVLWLSWTPVVWTIGWEKVWGTALMSCLRPSTSLPYIGKHIWRNRCLLGCNSNSKSQGQFNPCVAPGPFSELDGPNGSLVRSHRTSCIKAN